MSKTVKSVSLGSLAWRGSRSVENQDLMRNPEI